MNKRELCASYFRVFDCSSLPLERVSYVRHLPVVNETGRMNSSSSKVKFCYCGIIVVKLTLKIN